MPSMDIVSECDFAEIDNVVNQTNREISGRFDFKGGNSKLEYSKKDQKIDISADDELKLRSIHQILLGKMASRKLDPKSLTFNDVQDFGTSGKRQTISLKTGLTKEESKEINKKLKESKLKLNAQYQDDQLRVTGKKIDDLREFMTLLENADLAFPVSFVNFKR